MGEQVVRREAQHLECLLFSHEATLDAKALLGNSLARGVHDACGFCLPLFGQILPHLLQPLLCGQLDDRKLVLF